jgi:hypothetical protein
MEAAINCPNALVQELATCLYLQDYARQRFAAVASGRTGLNCSVCEAPVDVDAVVRPLENRSEWLRRVIVEAARRELMSSEE